MTDPRILLDSHFDQTATDEQARELAVWLKSDTRNAQRFMLHAATHAGIREHIGPGAEDESRRSDQIDTPVPAGRTIRIRRALPLAAALLLAAAAVAIYLLNLKPEALNLKSAVSAPIVTLIDATDTVVINDELGRSGSDYPAGSYSIESGEAEFLLDSRVTVGLKGETRLHLHNPMLASLETGSASFDCPPSAHGFTVLLPSGARVVDLGTRFRLTVDPKFGTDLEVLEGTVAVEPGDAGRRQEFGLGSKVLVGIDGSVTSAGDTLAIYPGMRISRSLDWRGAETMQATHWEYRKWFNIKPATEWQNLGALMVWDPKSQQFFNDGNDEKRNIWPAVTPSGLVCNGQTNHVEQFRWAFADWVCPQDGVTIEANDGVLVSSIRDAGSKPKAGSHIVVATYHKLSDTWTALIDSTGAGDQQVTVPLDLRRIKLDTGDRIRIAWRATAPHDAPAKLDDSGLSFRVVAVDSESEPDNHTPSDEDGDRGRTVPSAGELQPDGPTPESTPIRKE